MSLIQKIKHFIGLRSPLRVGYHCVKGFLAYIFSGNPAKNMYIIGVTGTKGKTTTSTLIATALEKMEKKVALITTAQVWIAGEKHENLSKMTMDSPFRLWKLLRKANGLGVTHVVLETSSHGIYYFRNFGIKYDAVLLTNISQDHLDLHGDMDHYKRTKARIFGQKSVKHAVIPYGEEYSVFHETNQEILTYSIQQEQASYSAKLLQNGILITAPNKETFEVTSGLVGVFNMENILAAFSLLHEIGYAGSDIAHSWKDFTGVPGRMEVVPNTLGFSILVDYAHTENSLRSVLETLKERQQPITLVFGATGDRDTTKRPKMGKVADMLADIIVLTDDDTYTELSGQIIRMVREGISRDEGESFQIIPNRREAISWAIQHSPENSIILIAGKGCETVQVTNAGPIPWSDRGIVEEIISR